MHIGTCCGCGKENIPLTFEHIPPHMAGNTHPIREYYGDTLASYHVTPDGDLTGVPYHLSQRGFGGYFLCKQCNEYFGRHYVRPFTNFCVTIGKKVCEGSFFNVSESTCWFLFSKVRPLAVFKQLIANFCCISKPGSMQDCQPYLLDAKNDEFPDHYRMYVSINPYLGHTYLLESHTRAFVIPVGRIRPLVIPQYDLSTLILPPLTIRLQNFNTPYVYPKINLGADITHWGSIKWDYNSYVLQDFLLEYIPRILPKT